ncbi:hypothetical protein CSUI_004090, partial [Cystoisospora suis]
MDERTDKQKPFFSSSFSSSSPPPPPLASHPPPLTTTTTTHVSSSSSSSEPLNVFFPSISQPEGRFSPASWLNACISKSLSSSSSPFLSSKIEDSSLSYTVKNSPASDKLGVDSSLSASKSGEDREKGDQEEDEKKLGRREGEKINENELLAERLEKVLLHLQKEVRQQISLSFECLDAQSHELAAAGPMCLQELTTVSTGFQRADQTATAALKAFSVMDRTHHERLHKLAALEAIKRHFLRCRRVLLDLHQWE